MDNWFINGFSFMGGASTFAALVLIVASLFNHHDSTDELGSRSGVKIVTDAKTGMQYLRTSGGGITPRVDADGKQLRTER
ncbi:DUF6440 family protein [Carnimonas bestiolae]|uniref:DUF6440 family protein n=1 Tax=Carnimonas bestiolae TaxID=3402172 RepID=UPI003EDC8488